MPDPAPEWYAWEVYDRLAESETDPPDDDPDDDDSDADDDTDLHVPGTPD